MEPTSVVLGGILVAKPVSAGTNLLLCVQCALLYRRRRRAPDERARLWGSFFLWMSIATLAGVPKHGFAHLLSDAGYATVLWISNGAGGLSTWFAQRATISSHVSPGRRRCLEGVVGAQLVVFLAGNALLGPAIFLLIAHTAIGLVPVIAAEARAARRGRAGAGWVAAGLSVSIGTGIVYVAGLSLGPWMGPVDIAHVLMGVSFALIAVGCPAYVIRAPEYVDASAPLRRVADTARPLPGRIVPVQVDAERETGGIAPPTGGSR